jgi:hypothetical protein
VAEAAEPTAREVLSFSVPTGAGGRYYLVVLENGVPGEVRQGTYSLSRP